MSVTMSSGEPQSGHTILCCMCGVQIHANPSNMCVNCLKTQVDITDGISSQVTIFFCKGCGRYQNGLNAWIVAELESATLLSLCLKKIKGLNKAVKLVHAGFIWTEEHSRRLKVKLTIQKEVFNSTIMQQTFVVEFICQSCQCPDCARSYTEHTWTAVTQVRQKAKHKRTFFFLEQCLIKTGVAEKAVNIKEMPGGLDFYFLGKTESLALMEYLRSVVPVQCKESRKLITQDDHNNTKKYKFTMYVELCPVCKHDLVVLPPKLVTALGGVSPLMLCYRVSSNVHLIDPLSLKIVTLTTLQYWRHAFRPAITQENLTKYVVLDVEKGESGNKQNKQHGDNDRVCLAEVTVVRDSDFGNNDIQFQTVSHLGNILKAGDMVHGYDLTNANLNEELAGFKGEVPEVVLVKKYYQKTNRNNRKWKLNKMNIEGPDRPLKKTEIQQQEADFEMFLQDVEENKEVQSHMNLYKQTGYKQAQVEDEEDDLPEVTDLLDDLNFDFSAPPDDPEST